MRDETFMTLMRLLPKSALSTLVGKATRAPAPRAIHRMAIRAFAKSYKVNAEEAERPLDQYETFAAFFTRKLKAGIRPIDPDRRAVVSPVDGAVSQIGYAESGMIVQAKGVTYPVAKLLGDEEAAKAFDGGAFATLYLSPRDYHRIHFPVAGEIEGYSYIPGAFWPVNPASVRGVPNLFALNERLTTYLRTPSAGRVAVVAVGATNVARIRASYDESRSRLGLISRLVTGMGGGATAALSLTHAGVAMFLSALALASGQERDAAVLATNEGQLARLALALRAAGLKPTAVEEQFVSLHPDVSLPDGFDSLGADRAAALLARSGSFPGS